MNWRRGRKTFSSGPPLRKCLILCRRILVISLFVGCGLMLKAAADGLELTDGKNYSSFWQHGFITTKLLDFNLSRSLSVSWFAVNALGAIRKQQRRRNRAVHFNSSIYYLQPIFIKY